MGFRSVYWYKCVLGVLEVCWQCVLVCWKCVGSISTVSWQGVSQLLTDLVVIHVRECTVNLMHTFHGTLHKIYLQLKKQSLELVRNTLDFFILVTRELPPETNKDQMIATKKTPFFSLYEY